ncbi:hypothetical protein JCM5350_002266 [Sporobolomyces pararoseus]
MSAQTSFPISTSNHQSTSIFPLPDSLYTPYYCEENVYLLIKTLEASANIRATWACFISNLERRAILFNQKASRHGEDQGSYVIWDYHVIAIAAYRQGGEEKLVVIDRDSKLGEMVDLEEYVERTFYPSLFREEILDPALESRIRVIPGINFLENFASDRSHMLRAIEKPLGAQVKNVRETFEYIHPPPPYPPIRGSNAFRNGELDNLWSKFLDMRMGDDEQGKGYGQVLANSNELLKHDFSV